jgi:hypothetical protein
MERNGVPRMAEYRLYFISDGARIGRVELLDCRDDDEAITLAWRRVGERDLELWSLEGLVAKFSRKASPLNRPEEQPQAPSGPL